jgi:hypothetical protein
VLVDTHDLSKGGAWILSPNFRGAGRIFFDFDATKIQNSTKHVFVRKKSSLSSLGEAWILLFCLVFSIGGRIFTHLCFYQFSFPSIEKYLSDKNSGYKAV